MAQGIGKLTLSTKEVMQGLTLTLRMPRSFAIRTRIACWLIGLAGRVINVPCEIEIRREGEIRPGDIVREFVSGKLMTATAVAEQWAECEWPTEDGALNVERFGLHLLTKANAASPR